MGDSLTVSEPEDEASTVRSLRARAEELEVSGRLEEAVATAERAETASIERFGKDHVETLRIRHLLARCWVQDLVPTPGRLVRTMALVAGCERVLGATDPRTLNARCFAACLLSLEGHHDDAVVLIRSGISDLARVRGPLSEAVFNHRMNEVTILRRAYRSGEAADVIDSVASELELTPDRDEELALSLRWNRVLVSRDAGETVDALTVLEPLLVDCERVLGPDAILTRDVRRSVADLRTYRGPTVRERGAYPVPWVFVTDEARNDTARFGVARSLQRGRVSLPATTTRSLFETTDSNQERPGKVAVHADARSGATTDVEKEPARVAAGGISSDDARDLGVVEVCVLGPISISGWDPPAEREGQLQELLCYLALHREVPINGAALRLALRPHEDHEISEETLHTYISSLRRSIGRERFPRATRGGYQLAATVTTDWESFSALAATGTETESLEDALSLVRGQPFAATPPGSFEWVHAELLVSEMEVAVTGGARRLTTASRRDGDEDRASWAVRQGLLACPYDYSLWSLHLEIASSRGPGALERAQEEAHAVLGDDARSLVAETTG